MCAHARVEVNGRALRVAQARPFVSHEIIIGRRLVTGSGVEQMALLSGSRRSSGHGFATGQNDGDKEQKDFQVNLSVRILNSGIIRE
jgi:hypothetical protein